MARSFLDDIFDNVQKAAQSVASDRTRGAGMRFAPQDEQDDWLRRRLDEEEKAAKRRQEEEELEAQRRLREEEAAARLRLARADDEAGRNVGTEKTGSRFFNRLGNMVDSAREQASEAMGRGKLGEWLTSVEGQRFMDEGEQGGRGWNRSQFSKDPWKTLSDHPYVKEFAGQLLEPSQSSRDQYLTTDEVASLTMTGQWKLEALGQSSGGRQKYRITSDTPPDVDGFREEMAKRGMPGEIVDGLFQHWSTEKGGRDLRTIGDRPADSIVGGAIRDKVPGIGGELLAGFADLGLMAVPGVGPALGGINYGARKGPTEGAGLWAEGLATAGDALIMGKGVNQFEDLAAKLAASRVGGTGAGAAAARLSAKAGTRGGLNVAEDALVNPLHYMSQGMSPEEAYKAAADPKMVGMSFGAGAAVPIAGAAKREGLAAAAGALEAEAENKFLGQDVDPKKRAATAMGISLVARAVPKFFHGGMDPVARFSSKPVSSRPLQDAISELEKAPLPDVGDIRRGGLTVLPEHIQKPEVRKVYEAMANEPNWHKVLNDHPAAPPWAPRSTDDLERMVDLSDPIDARWYEDIGRGFAEEIGTTRALPEFATGMGISTRNATPTVNGAYTLAAMIARRMMMLDGKITGEAGEFKGQSAFARKGFEEEFTKNFRAALADAKEAGMRDTSQPGKQPQTIGGPLGEVQRSLAAAYLDGEFSFKEAQKSSNFGKDIKSAGANEFAFGSTHDRHSARAYGYLKFPERVKTYDDRVAFMASVRDALSRGDTKAKEIAELKTAITKNAPPSAHQYAFMEGVTEFLAAQRGEPARRVQAAQWSFGKALSENLDVAVRYVSGFIGIEEAYDMLRQAQRYGYGSGASTLKDLAPMIERLRDLDAQLRERGIDPYAGTESMDLTTPAKNFPKKGAVYPALGLKQAAEDVIRVQNNGGFITMSIPRSEFGGIGGKLKELTEKDIAHSVIHASDDTVTLAIHGNVTKAQQAADIFARGDRQADVVWEIPSGLDAKAGLAMTTDRPADALAALDRAGLQGFIGRDGRVFAIYDGAPSGYDVDSFQMRFERAAQEAGGRDLASITGDFIRESPTGPRVFEYQVQGQRADTGRPGGGLPPVGSGRLGAEAAGLVEGRPSQDTSTFGQRAGILGREAAGAGFVGAAAAATQGETPEEKLQAAILAAGGRAASRLATSNLDAGRAGRPLSMIDQDDRFGMEDPRLDIPTRSKMPEGPSPEFGTQKLSMQDAMQQAAEQARLQQVRNIRASKSQQKLGSQQQRTMLTQANKFTPPPKHTQLVQAAAANNIAPSLKQAATNNAQARAASLQQAAPTQAQMKAWADKADSYVTAAADQLDDPRHVTRALDVIGIKSGDRRISLGSLVDPIINAMKTPGGRKVATGILAAANYNRTRAGVQGAAAQQMLRTLDPLVREKTRFEFEKGFVKVSDKDLARAAQQVLPSAGIAGMTYYYSEKEDDPISKELGILLAASTTAMFAARQHSRRWESRAWEDIKLKDPQALRPALDKKTGVITWVHPDDIPAATRGGAGKLYDILQNPELYDLNKEQLNAITAYDNMRIARIQELNASLLEAGLGNTVVLKPNHGILQWFTQTSVREVLGEKPAKTMNIETPGFNRKEAPQFDRGLGDTYFDTLVKYSGLRIIDDPQKLLQAEWKMYDQIQSTALLVHSIKKDKNLFTQVPTSQEWKLMRQQFGKQTTDAYYLHLQGLREKGWNSLPGIDNGLFHPDVNKAVEELLIPGRGSENGLMFWMDTGTNFFRQALFTADLSAWSMQGMMGFLLDPAATVRNAPHLIAASLFGEKYFNHWVEKNQDLWEGFTRSGGIAGREHEGLELQSKTLADLPGLKQIESRGFAAFLPIHRALLWQAQNQQESFIRSLGEKTGTGKFEGPVLKRLTAEVLNAADLAPMAAATGVALTTDPNITGDDRLDDAFLLALGYGGRRLIQAGQSRTFEAAAGSLSDAGAVRAGNLAARSVNLGTGVTNKQQLGITNRQSQAERVFGMRSPALTRNALILAKHALTDFGPKGAAARFYLAKTAALVATGAVAFKYFTTGEMDTLDPTDPNSILSPGQFMRAQGGELGSVSTSNPLISLARAVLKTDPPDGVKTWRFEDWEPGVGLADWYASRAPDITGMVTRPFVQTKAREITGSESKPFGSDVPLPLPVSIKQVFETGVAGQTAIGGSSIGQAAISGLGRIGMKEDPNYNHPGEKLLGVAGSLAGINTNPESLGKERVRLRADVIDSIAKERGWKLEDRNGDGMFDYGDLNKEQKDIVNNDPRLADESMFGKLTSYLEENKWEEGPIDAYYEGMAAATDRYEADVLEKESLVAQGFMQKSEFRLWLRERQAEKRIEMDTAKRVLGQAAAGRKKTDETVDEYLDRTMLPEDRAVQSYYDLFDSATGPDGELNFYLLDRLQADFMDSLDEKTKDYVERRIAAYDREPSSPLAAEYEAIKELTKPYFEMGEKFFQESKGKSKLLSQYGSYEEFRYEMERKAMDMRMDPDELIEMLGNRDRGLLFMQARMKVAQARARMKDKALDSALWEWYGYAPKHRENIRAKFLAEREMWKLNPNSMLV